MVATLAPMVHFLSSGKWRSTVSRQGWPFGLAIVFGAISHPLGWASLNHVFFSKTQCPLTAAIVLNENWTECSRRYIKVQAVFHGPPDKPCAPWLSRINPSHDEGAVSMVNRVGLTDCPDPAMNLSPDSL
jgi:hypothetical protein